MKPFLKIQNAVVLILMSALLACTPKEPEVEVNPIPEKAIPFEITPQGAHAPGSEPLPKIEIAAEDRVCMSDKDCIVISDQCSCSCGAGITKTSKNIEAYKTKLDELCKSYSGKMCKKLCKGSAKCVDKLCTYE